MIAEQESAALAERLLDQTITKQHITRDQLAIHWENPTTVDKQLHRRDVLGGLIHEYERAA